MWLCVRWAWGGWRSQSSHGRRASLARLRRERGSALRRGHPSILSPEELLEYEEKKRQAEEEKLPLPELVRAQVPFSSCLEAYGAPEQVDDFWSTALQAKSVAVK